MEGSMALNLVGGRGSSVWDTMHNLTTHVLPPYGTQNLRCKKDAKRNPLREVQRKWAGCPSMCPVRDADVGTVHAVGAVRRPL